MLDTGRRQSGAATVDWQSFAMPGRFDRRRSMLQGQAAARWIRQKGALWARLAQIGLQSAVLRAPPRPLVHVGCRGSSHEPHAALDPRAR